MRLGVGLLVTTLAAGGAAGAHAQDYKVLQRATLGGEGGWDLLAVDAAAHRLYVARGTRVMVIDADTLKLVGEIPDTAGVHGIARAPDLGRGFSSNGKAGTATIFDLKTLKTLGTVETGQNPDAILYDPFSKRVFTFNGRSDDATAIDAAAGKAVGTIELGGKPEFATSDGSGRVFVNLEDKSEVVVIDPKTLKVTARHPLAPGEEPSGMAIDPRNHRLFVGCRNKKMIVLDAETGKVIATPEIGSGVDANAYDPDTGCAFSSNGDGTLTVVHEDDPMTFRVLENVKTLPGARTMALDPKTHTIYLATARFEEPKDGEPQGRRGRPPMLPGSFRILVVGK